MILYSTFASSSLAVTAISWSLAASILSAQTPGQQGQPFVAGGPLGTMVGGQFTPMSDNVKVYGGVVSAESCTYDPTRNLIIIVNRGVGQMVMQNDAFISLLNHDGSVHTAKWIGVNRNGLILNEPLGSDVSNGRLYVADRDGGTAPTDTSVSVVRWFSLDTGAPAGEVRVEGSTGFNDIAIARDGTIYGTQTSLPGRVYRVRPDGTSDVFIDGAPLAAPNGIAIDNDGNIVVVNVANAAVLTFSPAGTLVTTEEAAQPGNDGIVILPDGTKYVSSVTMGGISRIRPGRPAELIATNIPSAASMCYDIEAEQLVVPLNANNAIAIIPLD